MSSALFISYISVGLFILVAIAVAKQTIEKNNQEKRRIVSALLRRARNLEDLLETFPDGFLGRDLLLLICNSLFEARQQLVQATPTNQEYRKSLEVARRLLNECNNKPVSPAPTILSNIVQIQDLQKLLHKLHAITAKRLEHNQISAIEAKSYTNQIQRLMTQTTVDGLLQTANMAKIENNFRLAIHNLQNAVVQMQKVNMDGYFTDRIVQFQHQINELEAQALVQEAEKQKLREEADAEWEKLSKPDEPWKKKAMYDE